MASQDGVGEVVKPKLAAFAGIALAMALRIVMAVAHHSAATAFGAGNARRPTGLAHKLKAFCVIDQSRQIDQAARGPDPSRFGGKPESQLNPISETRPSRVISTQQPPGAKPTCAITPDSGMSQKKLILPFPGQCPGYRGMFPMHCVPCLNFRSASAFPNRSPPSIKIREFCPIWTKDRLLTPQYRNTAIPQWQGSRTHISDSHGSAVRLTGFKSNAVHLRIC